MRDRIEWLGIFVRMTDHYREDIQKIVGDFLEDANLICSGMSVVGYEYVEDRQAERLQLLAHPDHCNHVDLLIGAAREWRGVWLWGGMKIRVIWNCSSIFPLPMGIPTRKRMRSAIAEYNQTGTVSTKRDDLLPVPSSAAEFYIRGRALLQ